MRDDRRYSYEADARRRFDVKQLSRRGTELVAHTPSSRAFIEKSAQRLPANARQEMWRAATSTHVEEAAGA